MAQAEVAEQTPRYPRGKNPNSLANLKPPFPKGVSGNPGPKPQGPRFVPAIQRWCDRPLKELERVDLNTVPVIDAIAIVTLLKGIDPKYGDKMRELLAKKLDPDEKAAVQIGDSQVVIMLGGQELGV